MFDNVTMLTNWRMSYSANNGVFVHDPFSGCLAVATNHVLTLAGCAATSYLMGSVERGEGLHAQAELAYTRMAQQLLGFRSRSEEAAKNGDDDLKRVRTALNQLWSLHGASLMRPY